MELGWVLLLAVVFLAYTNGANDNFKGVASLWGSGAASYRVALSWATVTTAAGCICALFLAEGLVRAFSAKGLVPPSTATSPQFLTAVALGASATVMLATRLGLPISTTHALTGALAGAGFVAVGREVDLSVLGAGFFAPLLVSPLLALACGAALIVIARRLTGPDATAIAPCVCIDEASPTCATGSSPMLAAALPARLEVTVCDPADPSSSTSGRVARLDTRRVVDALHFVSAGAVSFARGLNDAPKLAGLLVVLRTTTPALSTGAALCILSAAMAAGGWMHSRKIAETVGRRITALTPGRGLAANCATALLVIGASRIGLPVSTTHVSCGALFGVGLASGKADPRVIRGVLLAWIATLPIAACLAAMLACVL